MRSPLGKREPSGIQWRVRERESADPVISFEVETLTGLVPWVKGELVGAGFHVMASHEDGLRVAPGGAGPGGRRLLRLRTATAVYRRVPYAVPRPKALLGDQNFRRLVDAIAVVREAQVFAGFRLAAAGRDSAVFTRLAEALQQATGLEHRPEDGELLLRVRPDPHADGWEVLVRLTPRPLSARAWRECNRPGGLNAALAAVMNEVAGVAPAERYLNLLCGSGTLLVERALAGPAKRLVGIDVDPDAIRCSRANLDAAGPFPACELLVGDALDPALSGGPFDVITADLPWGDAVGDHASNVVLYPRLLDRAAQLAAPQARFAVLTHELRLFRDVLARQTAWRVELEQQVGHGGHFPCLYLLRPTRGRPGAA